MAADTSGTIVHPNRKYYPESFGEEIPSCVSSVATVTDGISGVNGSLGLAGKGARFLRGSIAVCPRKCVRVAEERSGNLCL